jgi:hypothetical protein
MFSKRELEGYLCIDCTDSPGIAPQTAALGPRGTVPVASGHKFQSPTFNCSHCERMVILRPDRSRVRGYCRKCDRDLCDDCSLVAKVTGECSPFRKFIDDYMDAAAKGADRLAQLAFQQAMDDAQRASILTRQTSFGKTPAPQ